MDSHEAKSSKETSQSNPEQALPSEYNFVDFLSFPERDIPLYREQFNAVVDGALSTAINPHDRQSILTAAEIADWRLFAQPDDPLPDPLVYLRLSNGELYPKYKGTQGIGKSCVEFGLQRLRSNGLQAIYDCLDAHCSTNKELFKGVLRNMLHSSNAFSFVHSFMAEPIAVAQALKNESNLSPTQRHIRRPQIIQELLHRGMLDEEALKKADLVLDLETTSTKKRELITPVMSLEAYLTHLVALNFNKNNPDETFARFNREAYDILMIQTLQDPEDLKDRYDYTLTACRELASRIGEKSPETLYLTTMWLDELLSLVCCPNEQQELSHYMDMAFEAAWDRFGGLEEIFELRMFFYSMDYGQHTTASGRLLNQLLNTPGQWVEEDQLPKDTSNTHQHEAMPHQIELAPDTKIPIGTVHGDVPSRARGADACRIIQFEPPYELPPTTREPDLVLELFGAEFEYSYPYIPGLKLTHKNNQHYGFIFGDEGDPYAPAEVPITSSQLSALADVYRRIGLSNLAQHLEATTNLSVRQLAQAISAHSMHIEPDDASWLYLPRSLDARELNDFRYTVKDGTLYGQCKGENLFLQLSLQEIFGTSAATITHGYALTRRTITSGQNHTQTIFHYGGRTYILDATASSIYRGSQPVSSNEQLFTGSIQPTEWRPLELTQIQRDAPQQHAARTAGPSQQSIARPSDISSTTEEKIINVRTSLETRLGAHMGAQDREAFYERIIQYPLDDPLRKTVETTLRAALGKATLQDIRQTGELLKGKAAQQYPLGMVAILQSTIETLAKIYEAPKT